MYLQLYSSESEVMKELVLTKDKYAMPYLRYVP